MEFFVIVIMICIGVAWMMGKGPSALHDPIGYAGHHDVLGCLALVIVICLVGSALTGGCN